MSFGKKLDDARQFAMDIRKDQNNYFLSIIEDAHQSDLAVRAGLQHKIDAIIDELCTPPEELCLAPLVRLEKVILPVFEPVFSIASSLPPTGHDTPPSPHDDCNQSASVNFMNGSRTSPCRDIQSVEIGCTEHKLSNSSGSTEFHTPPSVPEDITSGCSPLADQTLTKPNTPSRNRNYLSTQQDHGQHQFRAASHDEDNFEVGLAEKENIKDKEYSDACVSSVRDSANSAACVVKDSAVAIVGKSAEQSITRVTVGRSSEFLAKKLAKGETEVSKPNENTEGLVEEARKESASESSGSDEEEDADYNADNNYEESGDDSESSDGDFQESDDEGEISDTVKSPLENFGEINKDGENDGNGEAGHDITDERRFSKRLDRSRPESIGFISNTSDSIIGVQSSDEETPVLKRQKSKKIIRRPSGKGRKSLSASSQGPKSESNIPEVSSKDALCSSRDTFQGAGVVKAVCPDEIDKRDPVTQSNAIDLLVSKEVERKPPKHSIEISDSSKVQVDQPNDPLVHGFKVHVNSADEFDNCKLKPKCLNDPHQEGQISESESSSESDIPGPRSLKSKPANPPKCQMESNNEKGNLQARKKSVSFVEPSGGSPSFDVNGTLTSTDIQRQAPIRFDQDDKPRFKVGPDGKIDPASIQKLFNIVSAPPTNQKFMAQTIPKSVLKTTSQAEISTDDNVYNSQRTGVLKRSQKSFSSNRVSFLAHISGAQPPLPPSKVTAETGCSESSESHGDSCHASCLSNVPPSPITKKQRKENILLTRNENSQSEATPSAFSSAVSGGLEGKDNLRDPLQENDYAAKKFRQNWSQVKQKQDISFDQLSGNYPRTEAVPNRRDFLNDSTRPKSEARLKVESIRAARLASQRKQAEASQSGIENRLDSQNEKHSFQNSDGDEYLSARSRFGVPDITSASKDVTSSNIEAQAVSDVEGMALAPQSTVNSENKTSGAISESVSKPLTSAPGNMLLNLVSSVTSFLPSSASFTGMRAQKNKEPSEDEEIESAIKRQKVDAERREAEIRARREAIRIIKQKEAEEKQKRAEAKRRQLAAAERAKEEERQRREERRARVKLEEEEQRKRRKQEEDRKREERRQNVLNLKRKMEQERDLEAKRVKKDKDIILPKSHLNKQDENGVCERDMSPDNSISGTGKRLNTKPNRTRGMDSSGPVSYDMTPAKRTEALEPEEEEMMRKGKVVPKWADAEKVMKSLQNQADPDELFASSTACNLTELFGQQRRYRTRSSSGNWARDRVTAQEEIAYKMATRGFDDKL